MPSPCQGAWPAGTRCGGADPHGQGKLQGAVFGDPAGAGSPWARDDIHVGDQQRWQYRVVDPQQLFGLRDGFRGTRSRIFVPQPGSGFRSGAGQASQRFGAGFILISVHCDSRSTPLFSASASQPKIAQTLRHHTTHFASHLTFNLPKAVARLTSVPLFQ